MIELIRLVICTLALWPALAQAQGVVVAWGADIGQPPGSVGSSSPGSASASAISAGGGHSCAIQSGSGAVVCWGSDDLGQSSPPASVNGITGSASAIAAGGRSSLAIAVPEPGAAGLALVALVTLATLRLRGKRPRKELRALDRH